jgi:hypothetical protein
MEGDLIAQGVSDPLAHAPDIVHVVIEGGHYQVHDFQVNAALVGVYA